jgi:hypothetical protein
MLIDEDTARDTARVPSKERTVKESSAGPYPSLYLSLACDV